MAPAKRRSALEEGDTISLQGGVSIVHDDGTVTIWLNGHDYPLTIRAEYLSLVAKRSPDKRKPGRPKRDRSH